MRKTHLMRSLSDFIRAKDGAVLVLVGLALFMLLAAAGTALDTSRYLIARNKMITALDTATIAAATVVQSAPNLNAVGQNYFDANFPPPSGGNPGFMNTTTNPVVITYDSANDVVTGRVTGTIQNSFMRIFGFQTLDLQAYAEVAWQQLANVEVVLTVDSSPSMCNPGHVDSLAGGTTGPGDPECPKFTAVRNAANSFLDILFNTASIKNAYVGLVPFTHNLNGPGATPPSMSSGKLNYKDSAVAPMASLASSETAARNAIDSLSTNWDQWTRVNIGTNAAWLMLRPDHKGYFNHESPSLPNPFGAIGLNKVVVMLTDGENITWAQCPGAPAAFPSSCPGSLIAASGHNYADGRNDNDDLKNRCELMKQEDIIIYSVLFNVQESVVNGVVPGIEKLFQECATLPTAPFFHSVKCSGGTFDTACGEDLIEAYETIAHSLRKIRLYK